MRSMHNNMNKDEKENIMKKNRMVENSYQLGVSESDSNCRLEEARFWTRIMKEHAIFIKLELPCDQTELIEEAEEFIEIFQELEDRVMEATRLTPNLLEDLIEAVEDIIEFQEKILRMMLECELRDALTPLFIDHITREARLFLERLINEEPLDPIKALLEREVFWLRIMKEHIEFIRQLLDPSERELIEETEAFRAEFSRLLETARDLKSMEKSNPTKFNRVIRFTDNVVAATIRLRNFKATARELVALCKVLSIVPDPLLLDHVRREADKFLEEIQEIRSITSACQ